MAGERVLIIEDGRELREFLAGSILGPEGYQVSVAEDGVLGLQKAQTENPDLIILDMQLPRMNGTEVMAALRRNGHADIPVIMTTAEGSEAIAVRAFRLGARDYLVKPFTAEEMLSCARRVLDEERRRRESDQNVQRIIALNRQLERQLQEINTLYSIGKSVTSLLDLQQVLQRVVEAAVFITQAEEGVLLLLDDKSGELYVRAAKNLDDRVVHTLRLKAADSLAGQVLRTGEPSIVGGEQRLTTAYLVKAILYVPLKVKGRPIGVLGVDNQMADRSFQVRDQRLLSALADYAAIALENARLYSETESEKRKFETILRETDDAVLVTDDDGADIVLFNTAAQQDFGLPADAAGRALREVVQIPALVELFSRNTGETAHMRGEIVLPGGRTLNAHLTSIPGMCRVAVMQDITPLKELDRIKSDFVSTVSHDLRSPLTAILGYVDLLARVGPLTATQQDFIKRVQKSVQQITELIGDLLDLGRIEAGIDKEMGLCHFGAVVREAIEAMRPRAEGKGQVLALHIAARVGPLLGNELRLKQVVNNLVDNAIKYTPANGNVQVDLHEDGEQMIFCVTDDGPGIPLADQSYIFDRFYRSQAVAEDVPGTGLGLAIVKSIVEGHQGRIWCESPVAAGHGTMFTVVLPKNT